MSPRVARNTIAVLIVILYMALMLLIGGCTTIKMERSVDGSEKITVRAPPKDFRALDFQWHETSLRAGEAATAEQPWADVAGDIPGLLLKVSSYCTTYPALCTGTDAQDSKAVDWDQLNTAKQTIRDLQNYCKSYPDTCVQ